MLEHPALSEVDYLKKNKTGPMLEHPALSEVDYLKKQNRPHVGASCAL
jgi:hypothetical protein